ncbi:MAG: hypothetical protein methR_P1126 [Methyloprofundus sp.]|nr:MAG: hypothetical protein methR_P1126 [Methyloprofundus sp.]
MKKQSQSILLILMMLITPIASAFEHCAGMDMSHDSVSQKMSMDAVSSLEHQKMLNGSQHNQMNIDCHSSGSCALHVCGAYAVSTSVPTLNLVTMSNYSIFEDTSLYSAVLTSDLRPPITIL